MKTRLGGDAGKLSRQNVYHGVAVTLTADFATSSIRIMILVAPANQPGKIAPAAASQAATAAISSANPTMFSTRRKL